MDLPCSQPPREIRLRSLFYEVEQGLFDYFLMKDLKVTLTWILMDKFLLENFTSSRGKMSAVSQWDHKHRNFRVTANEYWLPFNNRYFCN